MTAGGSRLHGASIPSSSGLALLLIAAVAFALRLGIGLYLRGESFWDEGYSFFFDLARHFAEGKGYTLSGATPTAFRVPLYPLFLAGVTLGHEAALPVLIAQSMIGAGTVWCAGVLAQDLFGRAAALIAAAIAALYPYYVVHDTALQETSLFTLLSLIAVLLLLRARRTGRHEYAIAAGAALGALVLTRANLAPFAILAPVCLAVRGRSQHGSVRQRLRAAFLCSAATLLVVFPWVARSYTLTGSPTLSTQTGFFLWLGNNPNTFAHYPHGSIDDSQKVALEALTEAEKAEVASLDGSEGDVDRWFWRKGLAYIAESPCRAIAHGAYKIGAAFAWLPSPRRGLWPDLLMAATYGPLMLTALGGFWLFRRDWRDHLVIYAQFVSFAAVTAVFFGHTSYRAYLDVFLIAFAAGALSHLANTLRVQRLLTEPLHTTLPPRPAAE